MNKEGLPAVILEMKMIAMKLNEDWGGAPFDVVEQVDESMRSYHVYRIRLQDWAREVHEVGRCPKLGR